MRTYQSGALALVLWLALAPPATATPITITGGTITSDTGAASLSGTHGFSFLGTAIATDGRLDPLVYCMPCLPGSLLSVGGDLTGSALAGVVSVAETQYRTGSASDIAGFSLQFAGQAVVPPQGRAATVTVPFTMTGIFSSEVRSDTLTGNGLATVWLLLQPIDDTTTAWYADRVQYDFASNAHAVPEPTTLVLLVTGVLVSGCTRWRRSNG